MSGSEDLRVEDRAFSLRLMFLSIYFFFFIKLNLFKQKKISFMDDCGQPIS
jgi:hypothetical protein